MPPERSGESWRDAALLLDMVFAAVRSGSDSEFPDLCGGRSAMSVPAAKVLLDGAVRRDARTESEDRFRIPCC